MYACVSSHSCCNGPRADPQARQLRVHAVSTATIAVLERPLPFSNGDIIPTRFEAQAQAVSTVFSAKTDTNPESAVGLMTMAGKS